MYKIDEIMYMLDCNNSIEIQQKGIELAKNVKSIKAFILPKHEGCNKNVWENCAKVLVTKTDEELKTYLLELMRWIKDLNYPGAVTILERLKKFSDTSWLSYEIDNCVKIARAKNVQKWLVSLAQFLNVEKIKENLSVETIEILKKYWHN